MFMINGIRRFGSGIWSLDQGSCYVAIDRTDNNTVLKRDTIKTHDVYYSYPHNNPLFGFLSI